MARRGVVASCPFASLPTLAVQEGPGYVLPEDLHGANCRLQNGIS